MSNLSKLLLFDVLIVGLAAPSLHAADPTYWQDIRPVFRKYCTACHSARNLHDPEVSGGLALDTYAATRKGSKAPVIALGQASQSKLYQLITSTDSEKRMPLGATPLSGEEIALIRRWIDSGATEGARPVDSSTQTASTAPTAMRRKQVVFPTGSTLPKGFDGAKIGGKLDLCLPIGPLAPVTAVVFSPNGKLLATGSYRQVALWDFTTGKVARVFTQLLGAVNDLRFSPDGTLLAVAGGQPSAKGDLRLYQVVDGKLLATLKGHDDVVFSVAFHPREPKLASASFDKTVRVWNLKTHQVELTSTGHSDFVYSVAFSPDGKLLASASKDRSVKVIDAVTGKSQLTFSGMEQDVLTVAFSADGERIVSSGLEPGLSWWNAQTGQRIRVQSGHGVAVHELSFSKDGKVLASAGADRTIRLWNGQTGAPQRTISATSLMYAVALSPDCNVVVGGGFDGQVRLWDTQTGRPLATLVCRATGDAQADWLALTPEGYAALSAEWTKQGEWRASGQSVVATEVLKTLQRPELIAKALHGEKLLAPQFKP